MFKYYPIRAEKMLDAFLEFGKTDVKHIYSHDWEYSYSFASNKGDQNDYIYICNHCGVELNLTSTHHVISPPEPNFFERDDKDEHKNTIINEIAAQSLGLKPNDLSYLNSVDSKYKTSCKSLKRLYKQASKKYDKLSMLL